MPGAEVHGHLHEDKDNPEPKIGDEYYMGFEGQTWLVKLTNVHREFGHRQEGMIVQDDPHYTGHEIQGVCVRQERNGT